MNPVLYRLYFQRDHMEPHQATRTAGKLIIDSIAEIERLELLVHSLQLRVDSIDAIRLTNPSVQQKQIHTNDRPKYPHHPRPSKSHRLSHHQ